MIPGSWKPHGFALMQDPQTEAVRDQCVCTQEAQFGPIYNMLRDQPRFACACTSFDICGAVMIWFVTPTPVLAKRLLRIVTVTSASAIDFWI